MVQAIRGAHELPLRACWLTFDDGLMDHVSSAMPCLVEAGLPASFFPTSSGAQRERVLAVHKIQFIRAAAEPRRVAEAILKLVAPYRDQVGLPEDRQLYEIYSTQWDRWDPPEEVFIKSFLQKGLPEPVRSQVVDALFGEIVTVDERAFAAELYAGPDELRDMAAAGMEIGGHTESHPWLATLRRSAQRREIDATRQFLGDLQGGTPPDDWVMCYPHGSYDAVTLELLRASGCAAGLSLKPGVAEALDAPLELPRLDTNDLPSGADAEPNRWTRHVLVSPQES